MLTTIPKSHHRTDSLVAVSAQEPVVVEFLSKHYKMASSNVTQYDFDTHSPESFFSFGFDSYQVFCIQLQSVIIEAVFICEEEKERL